MVGKLIAGLAKLLPIPESCAMENGRLLCCTSQDKHIPTLG